MITASASSAIRSNRAGKSPLRPRSVWLKTARLLKSAPPPTPPMCGELLAQMRLPDRLLRCLRREQHDPLALVQDEPLDQHQADERLAEADAVAEERAAVLARDLHQRPVGLLLVAVELREHLRLRLVPLAGGDLVAAEELVERLRVDLERRVLADVPLDDLEDRPA